MKHFKIWKDWKRDGEKKQISIGKFDQLNYNNYEFVYEVNYINKDLIIDYTVYKNL